MNTSDRQTSLSVLARDIARCRICIEQPLRAPLPHEPKPVCVLSATARICIAGQAPGTRVHASGRPFTDPSGVRLRSWLGVDEETFYDPACFAIVPMGFCFPGHDAKGGDRPPRPECRAAWHDRVFAAMPQIRLIIAIGMHAQDYHLGPRRAATLDETVRNWRSIFGPGELLRPGPPAVLPLPHPSWRNNSWLRNNPWFETELLPVLRSTVQSLLRPVA